MLKIELEITRTTSAGVHQASLYLGGDDIFYPKVIEPTLEPIDDAAFILINSTDPLHPLVGETISLLKPPMQNVFLWETHSASHEIRDE
jgi:hypothetical protein